MAEDQDEQFFDSGMTWYEVFQTNPKGGNAWYILAYQHMAAVLNVANGASMPGDVAMTIAEAAAMLDYYGQYDGGMPLIPKTYSDYNGNGIDDRTEAIQLAYYLGVPHCE